MSWVLVLLAALVAVRVVVQMRRSSRQEPSASGETSSNGLSSPTPGTMTRSEPATRAQWVGGFIGGFGVIAVIVVGWLVVMSIGVAQWVGVGSTRTFGVGIAAAPFALGFLAFGVWAWRRRVPMPPR